MFVVNELKVGDVFELMILIGWFGILLDLLYCKYYVGLVVGSGIILVLFILVIMLEIEIES